MLQEFLASGTLNLIYAGILFVCFLFSVLILVGAEVGDAFDFDFDADADGDFDFISISPFALAMFGSTFGLMGLITRLWLEMDTIPSILWSAGIGLAVGIMAQLFFLYILSPSKSSHFSLAEDGVGREAEVIITIPSEGLGTIAYDNVSGRVTLGARSSTGSAIKRGEVVTIERINGRVASVNPIGVSSIDKKS